MNDLISKSALIKALKHGTNKPREVFIFESDVIDLINSAPVVKSIEHDAPSAPIEAQESVTQALEAANIPDARKFIFNGLKACSNHSCIVSGKRKGMGTNGPCHCVTDLTRQQLNMLGQRLDYFLNALIPSTQEPKESEG